MQRIESKISSVTVFPKMASVTREAKATLASGENMIVLDKLPNSLDEKSIQVKGSGDAILGTVKVEKVFYSDEPDVNRADLINKMQELEDILKQGSDKVARLNKEKSFLDQIVMKATSPGKNNDSSDVEPEKWMKIISFYKEKLEAVDKAVLETEKSLRKSNNELEKIKQDIERTDASVKATTPAAKKSKYQVLISLKAEKSAEVKLEVTYRVSNAQWYPAYEIRVVSDEKKFDLSYLAVVSQVTGEDWDQVSLQISTAKPAISGTQPELKPWYIEVETVYPELAEEAPPMPTRIANRPASAAPAGAASTLDKMLMKSAPVAVQSGGTAVSFGISGQHVVKSNGSENRINILSESFAAAFNYSSIPVLQPYVYLKAKLKNETEYPLLAGEAAVFFDGNFIAVTKLKQVAPTEEFELSLGIDEGFKVECKDVKKFEKEGGNLFSKKSVVMVYEKVIRIQSFKKTDEDLTVWDQLPISQHEQVKVQLLEPAWKENSDQLRKNNQEFLEWHVKVKAGQKMEIPIKYSVEFPREMKSKIFGIDLD